MVTKEQVWAAIATPDNWDAEPGDRELFFSDRLIIDVKKVDDLRGVNIPMVVDELRERPKLLVALRRWGVTFSSPDVADVNAQDHNPAWSEAATESCDREFDGAVHSADWCLG